MKIVRVRNKDIDFFGCKFNGKPSDIIIYFGIISYIQSRRKNNYKVCEYEIKREYLEGLLNKQSYEKSKMNKILEEMLDNQEDRVISECEYDGRVFNVMINEEKFSKYYEFSKDYTNVDIEKIAGVKNHIDICFHFLFSRYANNGVISIKEECLRLIIGKTHIEFKNLKRDIESSLKRLSDVFRINNYEIINSKNKKIFKMTFKKFKYFGVNYE